MLIILFAISAIAVYKVVEYLEKTMLPDAYQMALYSIWALTLGFMLISGAFGIWAIQFSAEAESKRRIGKLVDALNYLSDGIIVVDKRCRIHGMNKEIEKIVPSPHHRKSLQEIFPSIKESEINAILASPKPMEIEIAHMNPKKTSPMIIRIRTQPADTLIMLLISDVTDKANQELRNRSMAQLQLIGQLSRSFVNDFNTLLCGIAGNALMLQRFPYDSNDFKNALSAIRSSADKGISLAGDLMKLTIPSQVDSPVTDISDSINNAIASLQLGLPREWQIKTDINTSLPPLAIPSIQFEQIIINLALTLIEELNSDKGIIKITTTSPPPIPKSDNLYDPKSFAAMVIIEAISPTAEKDGESSIYVPSVVSEDKILISIISTILKENGGFLEKLQSNTAKIAFRILLPSVNYGDNQPIKPHNKRLPVELKAYMSGWKILIGTTNEISEKIESILSDAPVIIEKSHDLASVLSVLEKGERLDIIIVEKSVLGDDADAILRALRKLALRTGIVVIADKSAKETSQPSHGLIFINQSLQPSVLAAAIIDAHTTASKSSF